jgi:hypothetical protein
MLYVKGELEEVLFRLRVCGAGDGPLWGAVKRASARGVTINAGVLVTYNVTGMLIGLPTAAAPVDALMAATVTVPLQVPATNPATAMPTVKLPVVTPVVAPLSASQEFPQVVVATVAV